ncbi:MAG: DNA-binding protein [Gemmataceae bacterium]|nr:DNA-binding protein [Gemmataceae bacterium]
MYTVKQAAELLRISVSLTYSLISAGKIRHERYGLGRGTIRIPVEALDEYRRDCSVGGRAGESLPPVLPVRPPRPRLKHVRV